MRKMFKVAAAVAATSLAGFGLIGATGGTAHAATNQQVTGCSLGGDELSGLSSLGLLGGSGVAGLLSGIAGLTSLLTASVTPTCNASPGTVIDPTSFTVTIDTSFFTELEQLPVLQQVLTLLNEPLAVDVAYKLSCSVNGQTVNKAGSFKATGTAATDTVKLNLESLVGSPEPNSCTLTGLDATSLLDLNSTLLGALNLNDFSFGVSVSANTAIPGAIWQSTGKTAAGVNADICADDASNGNSGSPVQAFQCNSDLAQFWTWTAAGELVRNGDCLTDASGKAVLAKCTADADQQWAVQGTGGAKGTITNAASGNCLTAVSPQNGKELAVVSCNGKASQTWAGPQQSM